VISWNFLQGNKAQKGIWSSLLQSSTQEETKEIYFVFLQVLYNLLWNFEVYTNFWILNQKKISEIEKR
jgi:hypothetical protein